MEIPLLAQVECTDGVCGRCVYVLVNPVVDRVTHLVVRFDSLPHTEYMVPIDLVTATTADIIGLRCSKADLEHMDPFVQTDYIREKMPDFAGSGGSGMGTSYSWPYVTPQRTVYVPVENQQVPIGELAVRRGTRVEATDGFVGKVDEFLVNPENSHITHLVMREGHLWGQKDVTIPLSAIDDRREDTVLLKLDKHQVESLPTVPVHRRWS